MKKPPEAGERAPFLELVVGKDQATGRPMLFRLADAVQNGPVIVAFFPGAFTTTCTSEMACFTRDWNQYAKFGAQFIGVSVDSFPSLRAFSKAHHYTVPFGSDFEKTATREWGVEDTFWWGQVSKRATFLVDRQGVVRYAEVQTNADPEPDYERLKSALASL